jgi:acyl-CoA synthetase (AMP-forming)/AMP-acid ligase II
MTNLSSSLKFDKYKKYYHQVLKNLNSKKLFYRYYDEKKNYSEAHKLVKKIIYFIGKQPNNKKRLNIYVSCDKSFFMYVSILAILLTNNIWIPLSKSLPQKRIKEILNSVPPDIFLFDSKDKTKLFKKYTEKIFSFNQIKKSKFKKNFSPIKNLVNLISFDRPAFI